MPKADGTIGVAERKEIRNFTDQEFDNVRAQVRNRAEEVAKEREADIRKNEKAKLVGHLRKVEKLKDKATALNREISSLITEAKAEGIAQKSGGGRYSDPTPFIQISISYGDSWSTEATDEEVEEMKRLVQAEVNRTMNELNIKRTEAEKSLLISGLQGGFAADLLAQIPSASDMFQLNGSGNKELK